MAAERASRAGIREAASESSPSEAWSGGRAELERQVTALWDARDDVASVMAEDAARDVVHTAIDLLDRGEARVAEVVDDEVVVHEWLKHAILLLFRLSKMETIELGPVRVRGQAPAEARLPGGAACASSRARRPAGVRTSRRASC